MRTFVALALALALGAVGCSPAKKAEPPPEPTPSPPAVVLPSSSGVLLEGRLAARGTEPFWSLTITPEGLVFSNPEVQRIAAPYVPPQAGETGASFSSGRIAVTLTVAPCSDGMSTITYPMSAKVDVKGLGSYKGCAYARWDNGLEALLPAIDACLGETTEPSPVIFAAPTSSGSLVRLAGVEGGDRYDCTVDAQGVATIAATDGEPYPGERDPTFTRAPADAPPVACTATEMKSKDGTLLGWETDADGC